jgi:hypothetical protein
VLRILTDYFQSEREALRFMRSMAGINLRIPPMPAVERLAQDRQIVAALSRDLETHTVRRLSELHGLSMRTVAKSYSRQRGEGLHAARARIALGTSQTVEPGGQRLLSCSNRQPFCGAKSRC